jgi:hypothetical protein
MLGLTCTVYMGAEDVRRQAHNVRRMHLLGATVVPVESGTKTLKTTINAALRVWIAEQETTHYCFGTAAGPHPFPTWCGSSSRSSAARPRPSLPKRSDAVPDYVGGLRGRRSNAIGMFHEFVPHAEVRLIGVEAAGTGEPGCYHSAPLSPGRPGVLHGTVSSCCQTEDGQIMPSHSIAPGLDYPGVGPEHAHLQKTGRARYATVNDAGALRAFTALCREEGIIPALESCHAVGWVLEHASELPRAATWPCACPAEGIRTLESLKNIWRRGGPCEPVLLTTRIRRPTPGARRRSFRFCRADSRTRSGFLRNWTSLTRAARTSSRSGCRFPIPCRRPDRGAGLAGLPDKRHLPVLDPVGTDQAQGPLPGRAGAYGLLQPFFAVRPGQARRGHGRRRVAGCIVPDLPLEESGPCARRFWPTAWT